MTREGFHIPGLNVHVTRPDEPVEQGVTPCVVGQHVKFDPGGLRSYFTNRWQPAFHDVMLLAAAVEACDHSLARPAAGWARAFTVSVPVHDPKLWNRAKAQEALTRALRMLTGDSWAFRFAKTRAPLPGPARRPVRFHGHVDSVILFGDGLDSLAVATIMDRDENSLVARARIGSGKAGPARADEDIEPFSSAPFRTFRLKSGSMERSGRSAGFKIAVLGGLAACLAGAERVIVPQSGQTTLGPALAHLGQGCFDRRAHPQFTALMSGFFEALLGERVAFEHPALWKTKAQSLADYRNLVKGGKIWRETRSCQPDSHYNNPANGESRQCGVCPACMLRRSSLHAAGYSEDPGMYIQGDLPKRGSLADRRKTEAKPRHQLNCASGVLHMDRLAALPLSEGWNFLIERQALILAKTLGVDFSKAFRSIWHLLRAHGDEWRSFARSLPRQSLVRSRGTGGETDSAGCLSNAELGRRLRLARDSSGVTQAKAEASVKLPRHSLGAIETGDRFVRDEELSSLIDLYNVDMSRVMRPEAAHLDLVPRFKRLHPQAGAGVNQAIKALNYFVSAEAELEAVLGIRRLSNLPPEQPLLPGDPAKQAEADADRMRQRLGIGRKPVRDIFSLLERDLGMRVYAHPLESGVSGLFAHDGQVGACILVNSRHRYERQVFTCAHELGHVITARQRPDISCDGFHHDSREERYANAFSSAFLMPAASLRRAASQALANSERLARRHVITLANHFSVPWESLVTRLEALGLAPKGAWAWFRHNGGITHAQAEEALGVAAATQIPADLCPGPSLLRLKTLAGKALARGLLGEGQIADLLEIDRAEARGLLMEEENRLDGLDRIRL